MAVDRRRDGFRASKHRDTRISARDRSWWRERTSRGMLGVVALAIACQFAPDALAEDRDQSSSWKVNDLFSPCAGDCSIALLAGKSVARTPMTSVFIHFESPGTWKWDDAYIVTATASRTFIRYGKYFSIDPEIGVGRYLGNAYGFEAWLALYLRWRYFPWSDYVRTSIGVGFGPSVANNAIIAPEGIQTASGIGIANYFSPEIELGLPSRPDIGLVVRYQHRSTIWGVLPGNTEDAQFWTVGMRVHF